MTSRSVTVVFFLGGLASPACRGCLKRERNVSSVNANHYHKSLFVIASEYQLLEYIKYLAMHGPAILLVLICCCSRISLIKENADCPLFANLTSEVSSILYWNVLISKKLTFTRALLLLGTVFCGVSGTNIFERINALWTRVRLLAWFE